MAPHLIPVPCALAFPPPSHRDATTPSPCWAPRFMTKERFTFSNPTPSEPRLSPAATTSEDMLSALTPPLLCASISELADESTWLWLTSEQMGCPLRPTGGGEHKERAEDFDSSQGVHDHLVAYPLAPAITDFISDENRECCNNDL